MFQCSTLTTMKCHLHLRRLLHTDVTAVDANAISSSIIATTISNRNANTNNNHNHNHNKEKTQKRRRKHRSNADVVESNKAISAHMRHGRIDSARQLFDEMPRKTTVTYNALLSGYISNNLFHLALQTFHSMPHRDVVSYNTLMQGYVRNRNIAAARKLFDEMPAKDTVSWNTLISAYADSGHVEMAKKVFDEMPEKNSISWNGLLAAYVQNGMIDAARKLFDEVDHWETVSWNAMIAGYVRRKRLVEAGILFERMPRRDVVSWNTMISGHAQSGDIREAVWLFEKTPKRDVFTWTAMVSGFAQNGMLVEARRVFDGMPERNAISWNAMIGAYVQARDMSEAMSLFEAMPCKNSSSWNTILTGFAQGGRIEDARYVFDNMPQRDPVSWAAMIAGYSQGGFSEEALQLFLEMARSGEQLNRSSFTCALSTCADIALLECGKQLHGRLVKAGYGLGCFVGNALLAMYCKCGSIEEAFDAFKEIADKDVVSWNTMIAGYARHGFGKEALQVFDEMRTTAIRPDDITLVGVLLACSHAGLVDKGIAYFDSMQREYNVSAKAEHYTCMIDLLGRAGRLEDAQALVREVPMEPDAAMWGALLGASRIHKNTKLGEEAAEKLFEMEPDNSGMYVLLSNIYASSGKWKNVRKLRNSMQEKGVRKMPGFSWIEVKNAVHTFSVGDSVHPEKDKIYAFLEKLDGKMKKKGYVSATEMVLHDVEEEEKEHMLKYHSEKLAVAFGILNVPHGRPIRVIKNLRVCEDCHTAIKYISAIESRLIILRDSNRFHHFSGGACSCGDYW